mmetsp:Transcript_8622/g.30471  ORF Transcript_8622/g.30471 Transcript_8622/m.30471 type:complete len:101 (-) Transcript_8622:264-566(-)
MEFPREWPRCGPSRRRLDGPESVPETALEAALEAVLSILDQAALGLKTFSSLKTFSRRLRRGGLERPRNEIRETVRETVSTRSSVEAGSSVLSKVASRRS